MKTFSSIAVSFSTQSNRLAEYQQYLKNARQKVNRGQLLCLLAEAGVEILEHLPTDAETIKQRGDILHSVARVQTETVNSRGALITYRVKVGGLALPVRLLNIAGKADAVQPYSHIKSSPFVYILFGASSNSVQIVRKRVYFSVSTHVLSKRKDGEDWLLPSNYSQLSNSIVELAFTKLCSIMKIGPKVGSPDHNFDLVCYDDCVEFFMEKCGQAQYSKVHQSALLMEERLKYCVATMHSFGMIHKDIKPQNILVNSEGDVVLSDFDISMCVAERPGERSMCFLEGTFGYMSPQMAALRARHGLVDLYYNDMWGLREAIKRLKGGRRLKKDMRLNYSLHAYTEQDQMIKNLSLLLNVKGEDLNSLRSSLLKSSFAEFFHQINEEVVETDYNVTFIVRAVGMFSYKFPSIIACMTTPTRQAEKLRRKVDLASKRRNKFWDPIFLEEEGLRRGYIKVLRRLEEKRNSRQSTKEDKAIWQVASKLASYLVFFGEFEEAKQALERVVEYVPRSQQYKYNLYLFSIKSVLSTVSIDEFDKLFDSVKDAKLDFLNAAFQIFLSKKYSVSLHILQKLFPCQNVRLSIPPEFAIMQLLQSLLKAPSQRDEFQQVLQFASKVALELRMHTTILSLSNFQIDKCTIESKIELFQSMANASFFCGDYRSAAKSYESAYMLMFKIQITESSESIMLSLGQALSMQMTSPSSLIKKIALRAVQFTKTMPSRVQTNMGYAYYILARAELRVGNIHNSVKYLLQAISMNNYHRSPIVLLCSLLESPAYYTGEFYTQILKVVAFSQKILQTSPWNVPIRALQRVTTYLHLGTIYNNLKLPANSIDRKVKRILQNTKRPIDIAIALSIEIKSQHLCNPGRALTCVSYLEGILEHDFCDPRPHDMLRLCQNIMCIKKLGKENLARKWIGRLLDVVVHSQIEFPRLQQQVALEFCNYSFFNEAYQLAQPLLHRNWLGTFVAAECLRRFNRTEESIPLYQSFVRHNQIKGEDYSVDSCICQSYLSLARLCEARGDLISYKTNLDMATTSYNNLRPLKFRQDVGLLPIKIELNRKSNGDHKVYLLCKKKIFDLKEEQNFPMSEAVQIAFQSKEYELAMNIFRQRHREVDNQQINSRLLLIIAKSSIILRKLRIFFQVAYQLADDQQKWTELRDFLRERRQSIKLYLLYGEVVYKHAQLRIFVESKKPICTVPSETGSLRSRLRNFVFTKRIRRQSKYWERGRVKCTIEQKNVGSVLQ